MKVSYKKIDWKNNQFYGGYKTYWKLYLQLLSMVNNMQLLVNQIRSKYPQISNTLLKFEIFKTKFGAYSYVFVWFCLLKPLGQFYSTSTRIVGSYQIVNDHFLDQVMIKKSTVYKLFRIPMWKSFNQKLTDEEFSKLIK